MPHDTNTLLLHIKALERKLKFFEQHHKCCHLAAPLSPVDEHSDESNSINDDPKNSKLKIIEYDYELANITDPPISNPKWLKAGQELLKHMPDFRNWTSKLNMLKLSENASTIAEICGVSAQFQAPVGQIMNSQVGVMENARAYARVTKASQKRASDVFKTHRFQDLVFVSFCAVLEELKYPINEIDETMRTYVTDSEETHLKRLRKGAIWGNNRIVELDGKLFGHGTQWIFDHGVSISQYSQLASNKTRSTQLFTSSLLKQETQLSFSNEEDSGWTSLSIPAFVYVLAGGGLRLVDICDCLGYSIETENIEQICNRYATVLDHKREGSPEAGSGKRKRKANDVPTARQKSAFSNAFSSEEDRSPVSHQAPAESTLTSPHLPLTKDFAPAGGDATLSTGHEQTRSTLNLSPAASETENEIQAALAIDQVGGGNSTEHNLEIASQDLGMNGWIESSQMNQNGYDLMNFASLNDFDPLSGYDLSMFTSLEYETTPSWLS